MTPPLIPNEQTGLIERQPKTVPSSVWYRWLRSVNSALFGPFGLVKQFVFAAYGIERYSGLFPNLSATWQTLIFDNVPLAPRGISFDLDNNEFTVEYPGVYSFDLSGVFSHTKDNTLEQTFIRAYDVTLSAPGDAYPVVLQSQQSATTISRSFLAELNGGEIYRLEIGGGDVVTNIEFYGLIVRLYNVGEWRGQPLA